MSTFLSVRYDSEYENALKDHFTENGLTRQYGNIIISTEAISYCIHLTTVLSRGVVLVLLPFVFSNSQIYVG